MPRPRQRRGADAKKAEKEAKREAAEAEARAVEAAAKRARHTKSRLDYDSLAVASGPPGADGKPVDPDALPEVNADTKAYFKAVADQIEELEALGHGRGSYAAQAFDEQTGEPIEQEEEADDRPLLLRSALESLSGNEIALAGDQETSIILEKLLYAMDDFARRVLADRFADQFERLVRHRSASHVLQTLFSLASETVDREVSPHEVPLRTARARSPPGAGALRPYHTLANSISPCSRPAVSCQMAPTTTPPRPSPR